MEEKQNQHSSTPASPSDDFMIRTGDGSFLYSSDVETMAKEKPVQKPAVTIRFDQKRFEQALQRMGGKSREPAAPTLKQPQPPQPSIPTPPEQPHRPVSRAPSALADHLLRETHTSLPDARFRSRFEGIIDSRMKEVRNAVSFTDMITRGVKIGGLSIDPIAAVKMSRLLDEELAALHGRLSNREKKREQPTETHPGANARVLEHIRKIQDGSKKPPAEKAPRAPEPEQQSGASAIVPLGVEPTPPPLPPKPEDAPQPLRIRKTAPDHPDRPKIEDIRSPARLVGPVEELKVLTLTDFRRMGANIEEMKENLVERFDLLREDSLTRLHEGLNAWKESEVYTTYLDMGRESMEAGKPIADVIRQRSQANRPYLSEEEFDMMSEVNTALRY